jgi:archaellum component FlaF (FlaF/FlaG flagellin family)
MKKGINLKSEGEMKRGKNQKSSTSVVLSTIILLLVLISYGAIYYLKSQVEKEVAKYEKEMDRVAPKLQNDNYLNFYNAQSKSALLKETLSNYGVAPYSEKLNVLSNATLPETVFNSLTISTKGGNFSSGISFVAPSRDYVAKQVKAYKESEKIREANLSSLGFNEGFFVAGLNVVFDDNKDVDNSDSDNKNNNK